MRKIVFLTGTRADFGKIKSLLQILENHSNYESHIFVTGMHMMELYGYTLLEVERCGFANIHTFANHTSENTMDLTLAKTIEGFSAYIQSVQPDLIVVHGDRVEALAGAVVGSLNNILVAHIEGGEVSGTIDELIRHSTSKMSQIHFVSHAQAKQRLEQMGELPESIYIIGSPDVDIMFSEHLPTLNQVKAHYEIAFEQYGVAMFHPVTTEVDQMGTYANAFVEALIQSSHQYVVIYPNNDLGSEAILEAYEKLKGNPRFRVFPSIRFEYFLTLLKNANFIVGNSSAGIREAPYYGVPTINIGTRQENRSLHEHIVNVDYSQKIILGALEEEFKVLPPDEISYGVGNSNQLFLECLEQSSLWDISHQKKFKDLTSNS